MQWQPKNVLSPHACNSEGNMHNHVASIEYGQIGFSRLCRQHLARHFCACSQSDSPQFEDPAETIGLSRMHTGAAESSQTRTIPLPASQPRM